MKLNVLFTGLLFAATGALHAQTATLASGGDATGSGGTASFSIGQVADITTAGSGGTVAQGVQQPYDDVSTAVEAPGTTLAVFAYPGITEDLVTVDVPDGQGNAWSLCVTDASGRIAFQRALPGPRTELSLAAFAAGTYHLVVIADNTSVGTFTIVKIDRP